MGITRLSTVYCDDEAIYEVAPDDFAPLLPPHQARAWGADGSFAGGDPWTLSSASVDFEARGVHPGQLVTLSVPRVGGKVPASTPEWWATSGALYAVESASGGSLSLRVPCEAVGVGQPPAPDAGLSGVAFVVRTFDPQIENASNDLNRRFAIDPRVPGETTADIYDLRALRKACALKVLVERVVSVSKSDKDRWAQALKHLRESLKEEMDLMEVRWNGNPDASPGWAGARLSR